MVRQIDTVIWLVHVLQIQYYRQIPSPLYSAALLVEAVVGGLVVVLLRFAILEGRFTMFRTRGWTCWESCALSTALQMTACLCL